MLPSCACGPSIRGLAVSLDGQGRIARLDPFIGGALAVVEAARNVACAGGEPLGFTDCLNFGNPEKPEIGWELSEAIDGMAAACRALDAPDRLRETSPSTTRRTVARSIRPRSSGRSGSCRTCVAFRKAGGEGDSIFLAEASTLSLAGSEYQAVFGEAGGTPAPLDLEAEARSISFLWQAAPLCTLVHDASEGGLAVCLAEAALFSGCGAELDARRGSSGRSSARSAAVRCSHARLRKERRPRARGGARRARPRRGRRREAVRSSEWSSTLRVAWEGSH